MHSCYKGLKFVSVGWGGGWWGRRQGVHHKFRRIIKDNESNSPWEQNQRGQLLFCMFLWSQSDQHVLIKTKPPTWTLNIIFHPTLRQTASCAAPGTHAQYRRGCPIKI